MENNNISNDTVDVDNIEVKEDNGGNEKTVPYSRFQDVNNKRKVAEETLNSIVEELCEDVPEAMRGLIPNLPASEKIKWLREAKKQGLFKVQGTVSASSPDATRPISKPSEDLNNLSPVGMIARGYNK